MFGLLGVRCWRSAKERQKEVARFEGLRRGDGVSGSLCHRRGNCAVKGILGGADWIIGQSGSQ
jgi:hypothetical protein